MVFTTFCFLVDLKVLACSFEGSDEKLSKTLKTIWTCTESTD